MLTSKAPEGSAKRYPYFINVCRCQRQLVYKITVFMPWALCYGSIRALCDIYRYGCSYEQGSPSPAWRVLSCPFEGEASGTHAAGPRNIHMLHKRHGLANGRSRRAMVCGRHIGSHYCGLSLRCRLRRGARGRSKFLLLG